RDGRSRTAQGHGYRRSQHERRRRAARIPDRQGRAQHLGTDPGSGPRDHLRPDRRGGAGHPARGRRGGARRHRSHAVWSRHLRQPLDAGFGRSHRITARKVRDKAQLIAAAMLEASPTDLEWEKGRWFVKGSPDRGKTIQEIAFGAYTTPDMPDDIESNL